MKKLLTLLSSLTITSSIVPFTVACITSPKSANQWSKPTIRTDEDKIEDAQATLTKFEAIEISEAKTDKLKALIKSQIEANLDQNDDVTIEGNIKIFKNNNDELEDSDITINERDIKVTGQFESGSLTEKFTLNTKVKLIVIKTDEDKIKDAKATLTKFEAIEISEAKTDKLKSLIKLQIEANLDQKDDVTIEDNIKIFKNNNDELEDSDITVDERDIKVTGQFESGSLTEKFTLNTKVKLKFTKEIDISEITGDMIINWENEYPYEDGSTKKVVKAEKLGSLSNKNIESIIKKNLIELLTHKFTGIDKTIINDLENKKFAKLSDTELGKIVTFSLINDKLIKLDLKYEEQKRKSKIFTAIIEKKDWNVVNKDNELKNKINLFREGAQKFLASNFETKKNFVSKINPNMNVNTEEIQQLVKFHDKIFEANQHLNIYSVRLMYDLFKGTHTEIKIDLTNKQ